MPVGDVRARGGMQTWFPLCPIFAAMRMRNLTVESQDDDIYILCQYATFLCDPKLYTSTLDPKP